MHLFFHFGPVDLPGYSLMILTGLLTGNLIIWLLCRKCYRMNYEDFLLLEAYTFLGAMVGAKGLYFFVARNQIQWDRFFEPEYFSGLMTGGFVFYGGLIAGFAVFLLAGRLHKIDTKAYIRKFLFVVPYVHGFGRLGCYMAGCCYGKPWNGPLGVVFPEASLAPSHIALFPVQLVEAILLFLLAAVLMIWSGKFKKTSVPVLIYFCCYGVIRFILEYFRYDDAERGKFWIFSTSQWVSLGIFAAVCIWLAVRCFMRIKYSDSVHTLKKE